MTEAQKQRLEQQLWNIANELRGKMDADEFRDYILGFIFYKYLSEKQHLFANKLLETEDVKDYAKVTDKDDIEAIKEESLEKLGYFLNPDELFTAISDKGNADTKGKSNFILEDLQAILNSIEQSTMGTDSEDDFNKLFEDLDLNSTKLGRSVDARNSLIARVLKHLDKIDFELGKVDADVLGDAYEYLISKFASGAGKKAGEFYTPQQVSKILAKIVTLDKKRIKSAYDPACGSGSLLLRIAKEADVGSFYGQELNRTTYNLARMNMILHDVHFSRFDIKQEDTLEEPQHMDQRFEAVVANPPFSAKWKGANNPLNETDERFSQYGALAPTTKADFAFLQHMVYQLAENGTAAIVLPHGVLYRAAAEGKIRKYLVKDLNYLDAVIGLPPNLFYGTAIPACILVLKKCRVHDDNILFVDASREFDKLTNQNALSNAHVEKIVETYANRESIEKYAHVAPLSEVEENDFNLNITRYIDVFDDPERIELSSVTSQLEKLERALVEVDQVISSLSSELGVPVPRGHNLSLLSDFRNECLTAIFARELRFKRKDGTPFEEWSEAKIGDLFSWVRTNSLSRAHLTDEPGTIQNIHYGDIHTKFHSNFHQDLEDVPYLSDSVDVSSFRDEEYCRPGDLVIADASEDYADIGKAIEIIDVEPNSLVAGLHTYIARPQSDNIVKGFSGYLMQCPEMRKKIMRIAQGISVLGVSKTHLAKLEAPLPEKAEQHKIAAFMGALDKKIILISTTDSKKLN